jgi:SAM-dependent methyltransferase
MHHFTCNICAGACHAETLDREIASCGACGSNVRLRWIVHTLSSELFGESLPLRDFPFRKKIHGLGLSDPQSIADVLSKRFSYRNTCYHREPRFDIMETAGEAEFDFIVASEVFEHVRPPVQTAFDNLARLLNPGGFAVFSSPWESEGDTVEHFPRLHDWQLVRLRSGYVLLNRTADGRLETFGDLNFHGGPGSTLEMRVFSKGGLLANCAAAGFSEISMAQDYPPLGIVWEPWSRGLILRKSPRVLTSLQ